MSNKHVFLRILWWVLFSVPASCDHKSHLFFLFCLVVQVALPFSFHLDKHVLFSSSYSLIHFTETKNKNTPQLLTNIITFFTVIKSASVTSSLAFSAKDIKIVGARLPVFNCWTVTADIKPGIKCFRDTQELRRKTFDISYLNSWF